MLEEAIENIPNSEVTLITHRKLTELLLEFWEGSIVRKTLLKS